MGQVRYRASRACADRRELARLALRIDSASLVRLLQLGYLPKQPFKILPGIGIRVSGRKGVFRLPRKNNTRAAPDSPRFSYVK